MCQKDEVIKNPYPDDPGKRLVDLAFPPLSGKSFLQVGGNLRFFCGYAFFEGALKIVGLSPSESGREPDTPPFPQCVFKRMENFDIDQCLDATDRYDVIYFSPVCCQSSSMLDIFPKLMARLNRNGTLVMEINFFPGRIKGDWLFIAEGDLKRAIPSQPALREFLAPYVHKGMGEIPSQVSASISTQFLHVANRRPYAVLLMGQSGSGKTTVTERIFQGWKIIQGDALMEKIVNLPANSLVSYPYLNEICGGEFKNVPVGGIMIEIFNSAAGKEYACLVAEMAGLGDFVYDGVIHENYRNVFIRQLEALGYQTLVLNTPDPAIPPRVMFARAREESRKYQLFLEKTGL